MFRDNETFQLSAHLSFSVINVKEDSCLMVLITHVPRKFLQRNNFHLLSSVCLCGLFRSRVIYCRTDCVVLISYMSARNVIFLIAMFENWQPHISPFLSSLQVNRYLFVWDGVLAKKKGLQLWFHHNSSNIHHRHIFKSYLRLLCVGKFISTVLKCFIH